MSVCERCGSELVEVVVPTTEMVVVGGYINERETQDYRLMCPVLDCFEAVESEEDVIPDWIKED